MIFSEKLELIVNYKILSMSAKAAKERTNDLLVPTDDKTPGFIQKVAASLGNFFEEFEKVHKQWHKLSQRCDLEVCGRLSVSMDIVDALGVVMSSCQKKFEQVLHPATMGQFDSLRKKEPATFDKMAKVRKSASDAVSLWQSAV
jgi:hypothetical protein